MLSFDLKNPCPRPDPALILNTMPILDNPRHELFAQAIALGKSGEEAYIEAGYKPSRANASTLKAKQSILARVSEILANGAIRAEISEERVLRELGRIGFANVRNAVKWTRKIVGKGSRAKEITAITVLDSDEIDEDTAAAISEISQTASGRLKIKFHDKLGALNDLGRHFGMFKDRIELGGHVQVANTELLSKLTAEERAQMREMLVAAAARLPAPANQNDDEQSGVVPNLPAVK